MLYGRTNPDLHKVPDGIHRLGEPTFGRFLCPQEGFSVGLREHAGRADKVPRCERETCVTVVLLCCDVLYKKRQGNMERIMKGQR